MKKIILVLIFGYLLSLVGVLHAQEAETTEPLPTFLEVILEDRDVTLTPSWTWTPIAGRAKAFTIEITSPASWERAVLCVDGHLMKEIKANEVQFKWSFARLSVGTHTVTLVILDADGNAGTVSRVIN